MRIFKHLDAILADNKLKTAKQLYRLQRGLPADPGTADSTRTFSQLKKPDNQVMRGGDYPHDQDDIAYMLDRFQDEITVLDSYKIQRVSKALEAARKKCEELKALYPEYHKQYYQAAKKKAAEYYNKKYHINLNPNDIDDNDVFDSEFLVDVLTINKMNSPDFFFRFNHAKEFKGMSARDIHDLIEDEVRQELAQDAIEIHKIIDSTRRTKKFKKMFEDLRYELVAIKNSIAIIEGTPIDVATKPKYGVKDLSHVYDEWFNSEPNTISNKKRVILDPGITYNASIIEFNMYFPLLAKYWNDKGDKSDWDGYDEYIMDNENGRLKMLFLYGPDVDYYHQEDMHIGANNTKYQFDVDIDIILNFIEDNKADFLTTVRPSQIDDTKLDRLIATYRNKKLTNDKAVIVLLSRSPFDIAGLSRDVKSDINFNYNDTQVSYIVPLIMNGGLVASRYTVDVNDKKKFRISHPDGYAFICPYIPISKPRRVVTWDDEYYESDKVTWQNMDAENPNWVLYPGLTDGIFGNALLDYVKKYLMEKWNKNHISEEFDYYKVFTSGRYDGGNKLITKQQLY